MSIDVTAVGREIALPFVVGACQRYELPYDPDSGEAMIWWAGFERGGIRAVMGWACNAPGLVVFGPFGDGSRIEDVWITEMLCSMSRPGYALVVIPASPSLYIRRQSQQLELYGECRTPHYARTA